VSIEIWILLIVAVAAVSACGGYLFARRGAPSAADLKALEQQLEEARSQSESVQSSVNEHFEQSAILFGKLAGDYRDFLEHFSDSAQALGLSETRARELLEQGYQPLLTHEENEDIGVVATDGENLAGDPDVTVEEDVAPAAHPDGSIAAAQPEPETGFDDSAPAAEPIISDAEHPIRTQPDESGSARVAGVSVDLDPTVEPEAEEASADRRQAS
jgi:uncharacterized membrane-anchored protein YhcB (DUF1043 family)